jgi:hypothetical protein
MSRNTNDTSKKINRINDKTLEQTLLIIIRDNYIDNLIEELLKSDCKLIPIEYINENIRLELKQKKIQNTNIDEKMKKDFLTKIFKKECKKNTAKMISEI